ncbi:uncharacterized protein [Rutidosis leptorrhynchoides]|uniref:uncharacterized protein n=1 Tax=Rutidosis leptorrhynchoides TaxID=125765 RepID=UPI003A99D577
MPRLLSQQEEEPEFTTQIPTTYQVSDLISVRQTFLNKDDFLNNLFRKCLEENFQIKSVKSEKSRYTAKCVLPNCDWRCSAYKIRHTENFMVKKLYNVHTCSRTQIMGNNKHASKKVLGSILMDSFKYANQEYKPKDIRDDIGNRFGVRSFVQCCCPIIIVDVAHLKSGYLGTNLVAVAMDGNNRILPLGYGIGEGETNESLLLYLIMPPSIAHGISNVFPKAFHGFCAHHLFMNVKEKSIKLKNRAEHVRFSYLTSNIVESINALSKHARKLPVCMLLEFFRASVQDWYFKHRNTSVSLTSMVTPYAERKLAKRMKKSRRSQTIPSTNNLIEVRDGRKNGMVNLEDRVCSCGQWQL